MPETQIRTNISLCKMQDLLRSDPSSFWNTDFPMVPNKHDMYTRKINMEPENDGLEDDFPF